jgi:hypothetical protein
MKAPLRTSVTYKQVSNLTQPATPYVFEGSRGNQSACSGGKGKNLGRWMCWRARHAGRGVLLRPGWPIRCVLEASDAWFEGGDLWRRESVNRRRSDVEPNTCKSVVNTSNGVADWSKVAEPRPKPNTRKPKHGALRQLDAFKSKSSHRCIGPRKNQTSWNAVKSKRKRTDLLCIKVDLCCRMNDVANGDVRPIYQICTEASSQNDARTSAFHNQERRRVTAINKQGASRQSPPRPYPALE